MKRSQVLTAVAAAFGSATAFATTPGASELPEGATEAFATITAQVNELSAAAWPLLMLVTGGFVAMRLFKRFVNKAA